MFEGSPSEFELKGHSDDFKDTLITLLKEGRFNEAVKAAHYEFDVDAWKLHNWVINFAKYHKIDLNKKENA